MPDNDALNWSILILNDEISAPGYLFSTKSVRIEFVIIETEFSQLNDYCVLCLTQTLEKLDKLRSQLAKYEARKEPIVDPTYGDVTEDLIGGLAEIEIPTWEENYHFTPRAMCFILLSFFTEKSLKSLCVAFAPACKAPKQKRGESKTSTYMKFLREECGLDFLEPQEFVDVREKSREIRNSFAHGDWDDIKAAVSHRIFQRRFTLSPICSMLLSQKHILMISLDLKLAKGWRQHYGQTAANQGLEPTR